MAQRGNPEKGGEASLRSEKVSAAQIQRYLKGIDYPAGKKDLVSKAKDNDAPENVMSFMNRLADKTYRGPTEVEQEFSKIK